MSYRTIACTAAVAGLLLNACASTPMQERTVAASGEQECKIVYYGSASQSIAAYNKDMHAKPAAANNSAEQALAVGQVGNAQVHNPRLLGRGTPNVMDDAQRKC